MRRVSRTAALFSFLAVALAVALAVLAVNLRAPRTLRQPVDTAIPGTELRTVLVQYLAADSLALVPLPREAMVSEGRRGLVRDLVAHLATVPEGFRAPLAPGTHLLHYFEAEGGGAVIDLSAEMGTLSAQSIEEERLRLAALVRTVADNVDGVKRLRFLVQGNPMDRWGRHLRPGPWLEVDAW